jgi:ribonuclease T2
MVLLIAGAAALLTWLNDQRAAPGGGGQTSSQTGQGPAFESGAPAGAFNFYVLSLSWSPTWCEEQPDAGAGEEQCAAARPYAFVLHGLWPQNEKGWPEFCNSTFGERIDGGIADGMLDIMPSRDLVFHQWRKHGSCSGLAPQAFFDLARDAHDRVIIPPAFRQTRDYLTTTPAEIERAFITANPKLQSNAIAVTCSRRYLREVRICMDRDLGFRACGEVNGNACRTDKTTLPPVRG